MEAFELRWPEGQDAWAEQGLLLLVAVSPREGEGGVPCRVLGSIRPGSPFAQAERPDPLPGRVTALLGDIGVPTNLRGYAYLRSALIRAQERPEEYKDLVVRIGGYSDYFVRLSDQMQLEVMARTAHEA